MTRRQFKKIFECVVIKGNLIQLYLLILFQSKGFCMCADFNCPTGKSVLIVIETFVSMEM